MREEVDETAGARVALIALGSNLGDSLAALKSARTYFFTLPEASGPFLQASIYRSAPEDCPPGSPDFLNTVIGFQWQKSPEALLHAVGEIERRHGRHREGPRHAPRTLDADILCLGQEVSVHPDLLLPHPRLHQRRFVLEPLAEICPDLMLPGQSVAVIELLARLHSPEPPLHLEQRVW